MFGTLFGIIVGLVIGWNLIPQPVWVKNLIDRAIEKIGVDK